MFIRDDGDELFYPDSFNNFPLSSHKVMLKDRQRLKCFSAACRELIRPGDVVIDAGTGTGILAFLAHKAGAKQVLGLDSSSVVDLARRVKELNFPDANIKFRKMDLNFGRLPRVRADVILCETLGYFGIDEGIVRIARRLRRLLKPGGRLAPHEIRLYVCPVESRSHFANFRFWQGRVHGIDFSPMYEPAFRAVYTNSGRHVKSLAPAVELARINLNSAGRIAPFRCRFHFEKSGTLHGFVGWFEAQLSPEVTLTTVPRLNDTHWSNVFFPIGGPMQVSRGGSASFALTITGEPEDGDWGWSGDIRRNGKKAAGGRTFRLDVMNE